MREIEKERAQARGSRYHQQFRQSEGVENAYDSAAQRRVAARQEENAFQTGNTAYHADPVPSASGAQRRQGRQNRTGCPGPAHQEQTEISQPPLHQPPLQSPGGKKEQEATNFPDQPLPEESQGRAETAAPAGGAAARAYGLAAMQSHRNKKKKDAGKPKGNPSGRIRETAVARIASSALPAETLPAEKEPEEREKFLLEKSLLDPADPSVSHRLNSLKHKHLKHSPQQRGGKLQAVSEKKKRLEQVEEGESEKETDLDLLKTAPDVRNSTPSGKKREKDRKETRASPKDNRLQEQEGTALTKHNPAPRLQDIPEKKTGRLSFGEESQPEKYHIKKRQMKRNPGFTKRRLKEAACDRILEEVYQEGRDVDEDISCLAGTIRVGGCLARGRLRPRRSPRSPSTRLRFAEKKENGLSGQRKRQEKKRDSRPAQKWKADSRDARAPIKSVPDRSAFFGSFGETLRGEKIRKRLLQGTGSLEFEKTSRFGRDWRRPEPAERKVDRIRAGQARQKKETARRQAMQAKNREGGLFRRAQQQLKTRKKAAAGKARASKRTLSLLFSAGGLLLLFLLLLSGGMLFVLAALDGGGRVYEATVIQSDYGTLSDITGYFQKLETDLKEQVDGERIKADYPDCYEYIFQVDGIGHDPLALAAYLGAVFGGFSSLEQVKAELDALFAQMYQLSIQVREEPREIPLLDENGSPVLDGEGRPVTVVEIKKICYVTLSARSLQEVAEERMDEAQRAAYESYRLSSGGQQVYGPVMRENWTGLVSSRFGERIHPITGERTFHNGVDVAVPTGTLLYAPVTGTVIQAQYSDTAGWFVRVQNETGWTVTFMHMDSLAVSPGQEVARGDFVGYSGNTGRSTGPHLHLEIRDPDGRPVNPLFLIPSASTVYGENT
ncbi:MAG: peptidoglycan DD-metalloendopeptidase family protein [Lachnospiraceae bacterium]|nr:peptidoglycan DD-metalloendopeptidase family protein [Lachnospiraceae bacterium]